MEIYEWFSMVPFQLLTYLLIHSKDFGMKIFQNMSATDLNNVFAMVPELKNAPYLNFGEIYQNAKN